MKNYSLSWALACAGLCVAGPVSAATLIRGPYIQNVTATSAVVVWKNTAEANLVLEYGPTLAYGSQVTRSNVVQHEVKLTDLQPATRYYYRLSADGQVLAGGANFSFRTAPLPGSSSGVRFLLWGDSGLGNTDQMKVAGQLAGQHTDFALHVGDIIYGNASLFYDDRYFTPYAALLRRAPVWAARGNHDVDVATYTAAWHLPTNPVDKSELYYSFDYGDLHFTVLDSNALTPAMLAWAASDLQASPRRWKMLMMHHTIYSCGLYHASDSTNIALIPPIAEEGGADLVLYGHDHHFERSWPMVGGAPVGSGMNPDYVNPAGPVYVLSGGGCEARPLQTLPCAHVARAFSDLHFVRTFVDGDLLTLEAVDPVGTVRDRMSILKSATPSVGALDLVEPHGGEVVAPGTTLGVRWKTSAGVGDIRIELSRGGPSGPWETLVASTPNDGAEDVTLVEPGSSNCWLRIAAAGDGTPWDLSDASFALQAAGGPDFSAFVNFSPTTVIQPPGYVVDSGRSYDPVRGYGWDRTVDNEVRNTDPDVRLDTHCSVTNPESAIWQIAVPNGNYRVTFSVGDPSYSGTHRVEVEGALVVDDVTTDRGFVTVTDRLVTIADGFLSVRLGGIAGSTKKTKLCYIDVRGGGGESTGPVNHPPAVIATATPTSGIAPVTVGFTAQASDPDGDVVALTWRFGDGAIASVANKTHTYTNVGTYRAVVMASDPDGATAADSVTITVTAPPVEPPPPDPLPGTVEVRVNFQPASAELPAGYSLDSGRKFDAERGYGWDTSLSNKARGKNADLRLDSHVYVTNPKAATWDVVLPNGQYRVTVVAGDPAGTGHHRVALQGVIAIPDVMTTDGQFATAADVLVDVTDGRLRMRIGGISGSSKKTKPCYVDITPVVVKAGAGGVLQPVRIDLSPNPADRAPTIELTLDVAGPVRIELFDVRGRLVRSLYGGTAHPGTMQFVWDRTDVRGTPVQSGVYFLRTSLGPKIDTRKVLVVR